MLRSLARGGLFALILTAATALVAYPVLAQEADGPAPLSVYGALPSLEMLELSPSGQRLAFITVTGEARTLVLLDLTTREQVGGADVGVAKVRDLDWLGEDQILVTTSKTENIPRLGIESAEMFSSQIYDPGRNRIIEVLKNTLDLFPIMFSSARVVRGDPTSVFIRAYAFSNPERLDLFRIDLRTGRGDLAEVMGANVTDFLLGPDGRSVARSQYNDEAREWSLHLRQGSGFRENWETVAPIERPALMGLGINGDSVIVAADRPDLSQPGRPDAEFFDVNLETGAWRALRFEFSPDALFFHPVTRRLIGAMRRGDAGPVYAFIDDDASALWITVQRAFAGRSPSIVSFSDSLRQAVIYTEGNDDSGSYHLVDLDAGRVTPAGGAYPAITPERVAAVRPVTYPASDGLEIHGYLTTPPGMSEAGNLPLVVLVHGGPAARDYLQFDWWAQAMASRGYAVLQPNFRGSTGYGDAFLEAGYGEWGRKMQTDLSDGVRYLADQGIIDPERVCIVGASYGGYAAMAGPTLDPGVYRCAVAVAGLSDLGVFVDDAASRGARRENSTTRYWNRFMGAERLGDRSLDARSPARLAAQADAPILLIHGRDDTVVPIEQSRIMERALRRAGKPVEFIELDGEDHWLSRSDTRVRMLTETIRFLNEHNPPD